MTKTKTIFIEPMLLLRTEKLPKGADWSYEIKLDGYRALAIKSGGKVQLRSRNDNDFTDRFSSIAAALRTVRNWNRDRFLVAAPSRPTTTLSISEARVDGVAARCISYRCEVINS